MAKIAVLELLESPKIDFTKNLSERKILNFHTVLSQCGKMKTLLSQKKNRQINYSVEEKLFSRNFSQRCVTVKFHNFHTVSRINVKYPHCTMTDSSELVREPFRK